MPNLSFTSAGFNAAGKFGQSLNAGYGSAPARITALGSYTVETWFKTTSTAFMLMCGQASVFWIGLNGGQVIARYGGTAEIALNGPGGKADGTWHHAELTFGPDGAKLFVDGVLYDSNAGPFSAAGPIFSNIFGVSGFGDGSFVWTGELDEVAVWSTVRHTAGFTAPTSAYTGSESNLLALWHLDGDGTDSAGAVGTATGSGAYTEAGDTGSGFGSASVPGAAGSGGYADAPDAGSGAGSAGSVGTAELFLFAGQSNAGALGTGGTPTGYAAPDPNTQIWTGSAWATYRPGTNSNNGPDGSTIWGPEAEFLRQWRAANPGKIARIVKFTAGGTQLDQIPAAGYTDWSPASAGELYASLISLFNGAKANLQGLGYAVAPRAMFWTQGENDALGGVEASHYQANLANLIAALRSDTGNASLKFIGGRLPSGNSTWPYRATVNAAIDAVDAADALVTYVNTDDLGLADTAHYNSASSQLLGSRYYTAYASAPAVAPAGGYTEAFDTGSGSGSSGSAASGSFAEGADNALGAAASGSSGSGGMADAPDAGSGSGLATSDNVGAGAFREAADAGSGSGSSGSTGSGGSTEAADAALGAGSTASPAIGSGSATEAGDIGAGSGATTALPSGSGSYREATDTGSGTGAGGSTGSGSYTEQPDIGSSTRRTIRARPSGARASTGIDERTGLVLCDFDHVLQSVDVIFGTRLGELVMLRWFGSGLAELLGRRITPRVVSLYITLLALAIKVWEPRLDVVRVRADGNHVDAVRLGELRFEVQVYYRPRGHLGDFTVEGGLRRIFVGANDNRITVAQAA